MELEYMEKEVERLKKLLSKMGDKKFNEVMEFVRCLGEGNNFDRIIVEYFFWKIQELEYMFFELKKKID